jgi:hypothetical protein
MEKNESDLAWETRVQLDYATLMPALMMFCRTLRMPRLRCV